MREGRAFIAEQYSSFENADYSTQSYPFQVRDRSYPPLRLAFVAAVIPFSKMGLYGGEVVWSSGAVVFCTSFDLI